MKLIVLSGEHDCGKTTSLNLLHDMLLKAGKVTELSCTPQGNPKENDYDYVFENSLGTRFLLSTWGDFSNLVKDNCVNHADCELIICACNKNFMQNRKYKPFDDMLLFDTMPTVVMKAKESDPQKHYDANVKCAQYLLDLINYFVNVK